MKKRKLTEFGKSVKKRLIEIDMTQVELAEILGTTKQYLTKVLTGERAGTKYKDRIEKILSLNSREAA